MTTLRPFVLRTAPARRWRDASTWLTDPERERAASFRDAVRRNAWLSARWLAKRLVARHLGLEPASAPADLRRIDIRSRSADGRGMRPEVVVDAEAVGIGVSLAHTDEMVVVATGAGVVGVDVTPRDAFHAPASRWWMTPAERRDAARQGLPAETHAALLWSVREAAYKALHDGEGFVPSGIEVRFEGGRVASCRYQGRTVPAPRLRAWWVGRHALAVVGRGPVEE